MPDVTCPHCQANFQERHLVAAELCPRCETPIKSTRQLYGREQAATVALDIAAIDNFADEASQEGGHRERLWQRPNVGQFQCELVYNELINGTVIVRLKTVGEPAADWLQECAHVGLQVCGARHFDNGDAETWHGVEQVVSIESLSPELFAGIVDRLQAQMQ